MIIKFFIHPTLGRLATQLLVQQFHATEVHKPLTSIILVMPIVHKWILANI